MEASKFRQLSIERKEAIEKDLEDIEKEIVQRYSEGYQNMYLLTANVKNHDTILSSKLVSRVSFEGYYTVITFVQ